MVKARLDDGWWLKMVVEDDGWWLKIFLVTVVGCYL